MTRDYPWFHIPGQKTNLFLFGLSHVETCPLCVFVKWVYGMSRKSTSQAAVLWAWLPGDGLVGSDWISELWPDQITALMGGGDTWEVELSWRMFQAFYLCFFPAVRWAASDTTFNTHGSLPHLCLEGRSRGQTETSENTSSTEAPRTGSESIQVLVTVMQNKHNDVRSPNHITGKMDKEYNSEPSLRKKNLIYVLYCKIIKLLKRK